jgi:hypothetical protein
MKRKSPWWHWRVEWGPPGCPMLCSHWAPLKRPESRWYLTAYLTSSHAYSVLSNATIWHDKWLYDLSDGHTNREAKFPLFTTQHYESASHLSHHCLQLLHASLIWTSCTWNTREMLLWFMDALYAEACRRRSPWSLQDRYISDEVKVKWKAAF